MSADAFRSLAGSRVVKQAGTLPAPARDHRSSDNVLASFLVPLPQGAMRSLVETQSDAVNSTTTGDVVVVVAQQHQTATTAQQARSAPRSLHRALLPDSSSDSDNDSRGLHEHSVSAADAVLHIISHSSAVEPGAVSQQLTTTQQPMHYEAVSASRLRRPRASSDSNDGAAPRTTFNAIHAATAATAQSVEAVDGGRILYPSRVALDGGGTGGPVDLITTDEDDGDGDKDDRSGGGGSIRISSDGERGSDRPRSSKRQRRYGSVSTTVGPAATVSAQTGVATSTSTPLDAAPKAAGRFSAAAENAAAAAKIRRESRGRYFGSAPASGIRCFRCRGTGHTAFLCTAAGIVEPCFVCAAEGHLASACNAGELGTGVGLRCAPLGVVHSALLAR